MLRPDALINALLWSQEMRLGKTASYEEEILVGKSCVQPEAGRTGSPRAKKRMLTVWGCRGGGVADVSRVLGTLILKESRRPH